MSKEESTVEDNIKEVMELIECFGGMKQNSGIEYEKYEERAFYESIASDYRSSIESKLRELLS